MVAFVKGDVSYDPEEGLYVGIVMVVVLLFSESVEQFPCHESMNTQGRCPSRQSMGKKTGGEQRVRDIENVEEIDRSSRMLS